MAIDKIYFKDIKSKVSDVSEKGEVTIYVNAFNNIDSTNEISMPGSFKKSINEGIGRMKHLLNHDTSMLIGLPIEMQEDSFGLRVVSAMNIKKQFVKDTFEDYKFFADHDRTLEHSIGYRLVKFQKDDKTGVQKNLEYNLKEYSTLTFLGANSQTPLVEMKDEKDIFKTLELLTSMLKGKYSDEKLQAIENTIKQLEGQLSQHTHHSTEEPEQTTQLLEQEKRKKVFINYLTN